MRVMEHAALKHNKKLHPKAVGGAVSGFRV